MNRILKTLLLLLLICMICPAIHAGATPTVNIVLDSTFTTGNPWVAGAGTTISGDAAWIGTGATPESIVSQPTIALVDGRTYKVYITVTNTVFAASDTYVGIQLAGGTAYQLTENQAWDVTTPLYLVAGSSVSSGLEITAVNGTVLDTMTIDNVSVIIEQFTPSTNLDAVIVSGDIRVPAGGADIDEGFDDWTSNPSAPTASPEGWTRSPVTDTATAIISDETGAARIRSGTSESCFIQKVAILTTGKTYLISGSVVIDSGKARIFIGSDSFDLDPEFSFIVVASGTNFVVGTDFSLASDVTYSTVQVYELTPGPIDEYPWDSGTDYSGAPGAIAGDGFGIYNGERVYISTNTHAPGDGTADVKWYVRSRVSNDRFYITRRSPVVADNPNDPRWINTGIGVVDTYGPNTSLIPATGTATVSYGPTNHTTATGSPGMETDRVAGYIDLKTSWDYLNDLRSGKFGIISVFNIDPETTDFARTLSGETADSVGYVQRRVNDPGEFQAIWTGDTDFTPSVMTLREGATHNTLVTLDVPATVGWITADGGASLSGNAVGLDAVQSTFIRLGARADTAASWSKAKLGFTAILDLTAVAAVDAAWSTGLSEAINEAALSSNYHAKTIANAIYNYDNNIAGVYYSLNESNSGDVSSYYLLAYDITDDSQKASEFYGLVSTSGVEGVLLSEDGGDTLGSTGTIYGTNGSVYGGVGHGVHSRN